MQELAPKDGRRNDPNYSRLTGLVPKDLAQEVRIKAVTDEITISEIMEEALNDYLQKKKGKEKRTKETEKKTD